MNSDVLSAILRNALGTAAELDETIFAECDWPLFESLAARHGLASICHDVLARHGLDVPPTTEESLRLQHQLASPRRRLIAEMVDDIASVLAAERAPAILLRGASLLRFLHLGGAHPIPQEIGLLVAEEDRPAAERQLRTLGFCAGEAGEDRDRLALFRYRQTSIPVLLTSCLLDVDRGLFTADAVRARARPADLLPGVLLAMSPEHELIHSCLLVGARAHARDRGSKGCARMDVPWRALYDLATVLRDGRTNWTHFVVEARGRGLALDVAAALDLCERIVSVAPPVEVRRALASSDSDSMDLLRAVDRAPPSKPADPIPVSMKRVGVPVPFYVNERSLLHPDKRPDLRLERVAGNRVTVSGPNGNPEAELNASAAVILELCDGKHSIAQVTDAAACLFEVAPQQISAQVRQAVRDLEARGLVRPQGAPIEDRRLEYPIVNRHGRWHEPLGNRYCRSRYVDWRHVRQPGQASPESDPLFFTQFDIEDAHRYRARRKVLWMREPRPIAWWTYDLIEEHIDDFDAVLTYDMEVIVNHPDKCIYCPSGGCHVKPEDFRVHPKTKLVSFIASAKRFRAPGHLARHEFYEMVRPGRRGFTKLTLKDRDVDLYGPLVGNPIEDKSDSLRDYMFQIAIENVILDTYFTEKLIDCFVTGTIPIYRGSRRVAEFFDAGGILLYSNTEELFEILRNLTPEEYERRLPHVRRNFALALRYTHAVDWAYEHTGIFRSWARADFRSAPR